MVRQASELGAFYGACADHYGAELATESRDRRYNTSPKGQARTQKAESRQYRKGYRAGYKAGSRAARKPQEPTPQEP
jgi:hypothetical protein